MGWKDLLQKDEEITLPWVGGRHLSLGSRRWKIEGRLPPERGWSTFRIQARKAFFKESSDPRDEILKYLVTGYLVGDRLVSDQASAIGGVFDHERVMLIEPGLDRFARISAGCTSADSPFVYIQQEMPLGPEFEVQEAFLERRDSLDDISGVTPALEAAFRFEVWRRAEADRRRREIEERLQREEEERQKEARRQELMESLGSGAGRRAMAQQDFETGARAALAVGGAEYLDHRPSYQPNEVVVRFSVDDRRFECVAHARTLQIIDSGICLTAEYNTDDFDAGTKGDTFLSLESLPSVIREAEREGKLVVYRHVD